jgi:hypothetical protein
MVSIQYRPLVSRLLGAMSVLATTAAPSAARRSAMARPYTTRPVANLSISRSALWTITARGWTTSFAMSPPGYARGVSSTAKISSMGSNTRPRRSLGFCKGAISAS